MASSAFALSGRARAEMDDPLFDSHAHIFSADTARYPVDTRNAREGEENLRRRIAENSISAERLLAWWRESGVVGGASVQYNTIYRTNNAYLLDASDTHPEMLSAVVILDAQRPETPAQLERLIAERGVVGLRLFGAADATGAYPWLDSEAALETWRMAERYALSMVVMYTPAAASASALARVAALARAFPRLTITLDHFGWPASDPTNLGLHAPLVALKTIPNLYYKITSINFSLFEEYGIDAPQFVRRAADIFGAERMMWGSDVGNTLESYASMAARARASASLLDASERRLYLCDTARGLFGRGRG